MATAATGGAEVAAGAAEARETDGVVTASEDVAATPDPPPADELRETCVACDVGVSTVSSSGVEPPQPGQNRLLGVRAAWQEGQVRGIVCVSADTIPTRKIIPASFQERP